MDWATMYLVSMYTETKPEKLIRILSQQAKTGDYFSCLLALRWLYFSKQFPSS